MKGNPLHQLNQAQLTAKELEKLAWIFDGTPKAIRRGTGGLVLASPTEIILPRTKENSSNDIRVKMVFYELERNQQHQIISKTIITATKLVSINEIEKGFKVGLDLKGFVVDFGWGIIPVRFIAKLVDERGFEWALAARQDEYEKAKLSKTTELIHLFEVPQKLLRWIEPFSAKGEKDFQWAKKNLETLLLRKENIIPEILQLPSPFALDPNLTIHQMDQRLKELTGSFNCWDLSLLPLDENPEP